MNKTFTTKEQIISVNGIFDTFYAEVTEPSVTAKKLSSALLKTARALTCSKARCLVRAFSAAGSLVGLIGIAGAVEVGNLSPAAGLLLGACMIVVEYLCLSPRRGSKG